MHDDISHHQNEDVAGYLTAVERGLNWLVINKHSGSGQPNDEVYHLIHQSQIILEKGSPAGLIEAAGFPATRFGFCSSRATLKEAWDLCKRRDYQQLLITDIDDRIIGVLPVEEILQYTQKD
jgi:hypothetical protein